MRILPKRFQRGHSFRPEDLARFRVAVTEFLRRAAPERSQLLIDGPGLGLTNHAYAVGLLGWDALLRLARVDSFSSTVYLPLFALASHEGQLLEDRNSISDWNERNKRRHSIHSKFSFLKLLGPFCRRAYFFDIATAEAAFADSVTPEFAARKVSSLPSNWVFWTYSVTKQEFVEISADSRLKEMTLSDAVGACVAVPHIFSRKKFQGEEFIDPLFGRDIAGLYRRLRKETANCLFLHMDREGTHDGVRFLKIHSQGSGVQRVIVDFLYFFFDGRNDEVAQAWQVGLFDLVPVSRV